MSSARSSPLATREPRVPVVERMAATVGARPMKDRCTPVSFWVYEPSAAMRPAWSAASDCRTNPAVVMNVAQPSPKLSASSPCHGTSTGRVTAPSSVEGCVSNVEITVPSSAATSLAASARTLNATIPHLPERVAGTNHVPAAFVERQPLNVPAIAFSLSSYDSAAWFSRSLMPWRDSLSCRPAWSHCEYSSLKLCEAVPDQSPEMSPSTRDLRFDSCDSIDCEPDDSWPATPASESEVTRISAMVSSVGERVQGCSGTLPRRDGGA